MALGGGSATLDSQSNFLKKKIGWPLGWFGHPRLAGMGGRNHPQGQTVALGGGLTTPRVILKNKKVLFYYLFFFNIK
jgi:hypothetical protein